MDEALLPSPGSGVAHAHLRSGAPERVALVEEHGLNEFDCVRRLTGFLHSGLDRRPFF